MAEQLNGNFEEFTSQANKEKWSRKKILRMVFDHYMQAILTGSALEEASYENDVQLDLIRKLVDLGRQSNVAQEFSPEALNKYFAKFSSKRQQRRQASEFLLGLALQSHERMARADGVSKSQSDRAKDKPRKLLYNSPMKLCIRAMRKWHRVNPSEDVFGFLTAVSAEENDYGVYIYETVSGKYAVDCEDSYLTDRATGKDKKMEKKVEIRTLKAWFRLACQ